MFPEYSLPPRTVVGLVRDLAMARRRSFREDARNCIARLNPPLRVLGEEYIPQAGPCVITFNHYYRPGFNAWWLGLALAATVPMNMHIVITGELTYPGRWYAPLGMFLSKIILHRIARVYGFTAMPPMPPRLKDVEARAEAVRKVVDYVKRSERPVLGLAPEGGDSADGKLARPASGLGRFVLLLAAAGLRFVPVGAFEADGEFCLKFGAVYELRVPPRLSSDEKDRIAATMVMEHIAQLVPENLRGEFS